MAPRIEYASCWITRDPDPPAAERADDGDDPAHHRADQVLHRKELELEPPLEDRGVDPPQSGKHQQRRQSPKDPRQARLMDERRDQARPKAESPARTVLTERLNQNAALKCPGRISARCTTASAIP